MPGGFLTKAWQRSDAEHRLSSSHPCWDAARGWSLSPGPGQAPRRGHADAHVLTEAVRVHGASWAAGLLTCHVEWGRATQFLWFDLCWYDKPAPLSPGEVKHGERTQITIH